MSPEEAIGTLRKFGPRLVDGSMVLKQVDGLDEASVLRIGCGLCGLACCQFFAGNTDHRDPITCPGGTIRTAKSNPGGTMTDNGNQIVLDPKSGKISTQPVRPTIAGLDDPKELGRFYETAPCRPAPEPGVNFAPNVEVVAVNDLPQAA